MRRVEDPSPVDMAWRHLRSPVRAPLRAWFAQRLFSRQIRDFGLSVVTAGEAMAVTPGSASGPTMVIHDPKTFFARIGRDGTLGLGESYMLGAWSTSQPIGRASENARAASDDLAAWLATYAASIRDRSFPLARPLRWLRQATLPRSPENSVGGAARNIEAHYDLDLRLFQSFLDPTLTYSSGLFSEDTPDLEAAQRRKVESLLDLAQVHAGTRLLDIGCGFGFLITRAGSDRRCRATGITLSNSQFGYCRNLVDSLELADRVVVELDDYRTHQGEYDAIVSVEMIEAVGATYWVDYFRTIDRLLVDGGRVALQAITFPHRRMLASKNDFSWVDRYIFPGGVLPSLREIDTILRNHTSLEIVDARRISDSYAKTLELWRHRLLSSRDALASYGFDDVFIRLWTLYFAYFEAGFRSRLCDVWQLALARRPALSVRRRRISRDEATSTTPAEPSPVPEVVLGHR